MDCELDEDLKLLLTVSNCLDGKKALKIFKDHRTAKLVNEASAKKKQIIENAGKCEVCGFSYKPILQIHHILPISKYGDNQMNNIICVCPSCHKMLHHMYKNLDKDAELINEEAYRVFDKKIIKNLLNILQAYIKKTITKNTLMKRFLDEVNDCVESND